MNTVLWKAPGRDFAVDRKAQLTWDVLGWDQLLEKQKFCWAAGMKPLAESRGGRVAVRAWGHPAGECRKVVRDMARGCSAW